MGKGGGPAPRSKFSSHSLFFPLSLAPNSQAVSLRQPRLQPPSPHGQVPGHTPEREREGERTSAGSLRQARDPIELNWPPPPRALLSCRVVGAARLFFGLPRPAAPVRSAAALIPGTHQKEMPGDGLGVPRGLGHTGRRLRQPRPRGKAGGRKAIVPWAGPCAGDRALTPDSRTGPAMPADVPSGRQKPGLGRLEAERGHVAGVLGRHCRAPARRGRGESALACLTRGTAAGPRRRRPSRPAHPVPPNPAPRPS